YQVFGNPMERDVPSLLSFSANPQVLNAPAFMPVVRNTELAQFFPPKTVIEERGEDCAVSDSLQGFLGWKGEQLSGLVIGDGWRFAFITLHLRSLNSFHGIVRHGVLVAEVLEERRECRKAVSDGCAAQDSLAQRVPPGDHVSRRYEPEFLRAPDAC